MSGTKKPSSKKSVVSTVTDGLEKSKAQAPVTQKTKRTPARTKPAPKGSTSEIVTASSSSIRRTNATGDDVTPSSPVVAPSTPVVTLSKNPVEEAPVTTGANEAPSSSPRVTVTNRFVEEAPVTTGANVAPSSSPRVTVTNRTVEEAAPSSAFTRDSRPPLPSSLTTNPPIGAHAGRSKGSERPKPGLTDFDLPSDRESLRQSVASHVEYTQGKDEYSATPWDYFYATVRAVRDRLFDRWNKTQQSYYRSEKRRVYYLSLEYLLGRTLEDTLVNLELHGTMQQALGELRLELSDIAREEPDAGLGNGGLGRLAACLLESMATTGIAAIGYGIRYEYGIFEQQIVRGRQIERADNWLRYGSPWEVLRPETRYLVRFGGRVEPQTDASGRQVFRWTDTEQVWAVACDYLVPGYRNDVVNTLRLWTAKATKGFAFECFNAGDYTGAVEAKNRSENLSRVLYPNDDTEQGRELRLKQEYFFVSATIQDAIYRHMKTQSSLVTLPDQAVFHLNDTHPGIAIAELMRLLVDEYGFGWEEAWGITTKCFAYTNHTVLPEALETWPVSLLERLLPRQLQIIYEVNRRFLADVQARFPGDSRRVARMSLFAEIPEKRLRMAHLCIVGAQTVNGVSELHGRILRDSIFRDFAELWPQKFTHVTNGITVRRWLRKSNPSLAELITEQIGERWLTDAHQLRRLQPLAADSAFRERWRAVKRDNKERLATALKQVYGLSFDPESLLDVQIKRIHEYKRQLLNILHVITLFLNYRATGVPANVPKRTFLFAGKAAPGYTRAKEIVELIVAVGKTIEQDPRVRDALKVLFVPNYGVSLAELIIPAADLSEQISLAGTEASGTGNMKLALNGALTIGTADGANLELAEAVGLKNLFFFGLTAAEVEGTIRNGYEPRRIYAMNAEIRAAIDAIGRGLFSPDQPGRFAGIVQSLLVEDRFLVLADFVSYRNCHRAVVDARGKVEDFTRASIMNTCNFGRFSSDEVVRTYARDIWKVTA